MSKKHRMQPVEIDRHGVVRFKGNAIVRALLDRDTERGRVYPDFPARSNGGLNWIAIQDFSQEDQEQFAQLIGYSVSGYNELSYVSDKSAEEANECTKKILTQHKRCPVVWRAGLLQAPGDNRIDGTQCSLLYGHEGDHQCK